MAALALSKLTRSNYNGNKNAAVINNLVVISSKRRFCVVVAMGFFAMLTCGSATANAREQH